MTVVCLSKCEARYVPCGGREKQSKKQMSERANQGKVWRYVFLLPCHGAQSPLLFPHCLMWRENPGDEGISYLLRKYSERAEKGQNMLLVLAYVDNMARTDK